MKLKDLLAGTAVLEWCAAAELDIAGVAYDSRRVEPGWAFVAIAGFANDGNRFIPMALERGAAVVITAVRPAQDIPYVLVESDRLALAQMGANWYAHPAEKMTLIGVTGTNGKTSVTLLLKQVLEKALGAKVGLIGTMYNAVGQEILSTERTTPESFELHGLFARMVEAGCAFAVMEVSSHAIALERVGGMTFDVAAFTNLTEDHLDFHGTMENYCAAKAELFRRCRVGILNRDDAWFGKMCENAGCSVVTTGITEQADVYAKDVQLLGDRVRFTAVSGITQAAVEVPIPGRFTVYNALTVLAVAQQLGVDLPQAAQALRTVSGVKGRVEVVPTPGKPYTVLIDYAHTPDGLENVLRSVKAVCRGRVLAVFGCGGDRDPIKRPIMGRIGTEIADYSIITSDNPRTEEPMAIIRDILKGIAPDAGYEVVENRRQAIRRAMDLAKEDDIVVLAGKGHETYQEINHIKYHLDEREEVAAYLQEIEGTQWEN